MSGGISPPCLHFRSVEGEVALLPSSVVYQETRAFMTTDVRTLHRKVNCLYDLLLQTEQSSNIEKQNIT
jgi:hypothetical protein